MDRVVTRPVRVKRDREGDTGHVIRVVSYTAECTCGWRSDFAPSFREAMTAGHAHADRHRTETR